MPGAFGETFGGPSNRGTDQNSYLGNANLPRPWWLSGVILWDGDTSTRIWVKTSGLGRECHPFLFNKLELGEIFRFTQRRYIIRSDKIPGCGST